MDMYQILKSLQAVENKTLTESTEYGMNEIADADFDADALAKHKSRLAREKNRMSLSMPKPGGGPRKSDVPAAARAARGEAPLSLKDLDEADGKEIDYDSLEVDGIDYRDAPDFADAYFIDGYYTDGTPLSDEDLDRLNDDGDLVYQYVEKVVYESEAVTEEKVDYLKGPDSGAEVVINGKPAVVLGEIPAQRGSATYYAVQYKDQRYPTRKDGGKTFDQVNVNLFYRELPSFKNKSQQSESQYGVGEGNEFAGKLAKARSIGAENFEVDGKKYPVKESKKAKPDFADIDGDGDKKEPMKQAAKDAKKGKAAKSSAAMKGMFGGDANELTKDLKIREGYADFFDKKIAYQKIGATVDGSDSDYTVTFRDGKRKRYVTKDGRRQVTTLSPVDRQDDVDDEGNVVKRSRGRPAGTGRAMGAKGPTGRSKLMREQDALSQSLDDLNVGSQIGKVILSKYKYSVDDSYSEQDLQKLINVAKVYINKGERAGLQAQLKSGMSDLVDEVLSKANAGHLRTMWDLDEGMHPADRGEYDREGDMALNQVHQIADAVRELHSILGADDNLPEWVQAKITKALDYIDTARDYLGAEGEMNREEMPEVAPVAVALGRAAVAGAASGTVQSALSDEEIDEAGYSAKAARAGKDIGKPGKNFSKIAKGAAERYGSKAAGERVAGAVLNKLRHPKEGVEEEGLEKHSTGAVKTAAGKDHAADKKSGVPANISTAELKAELKRRSQVEEESTDTKDQHAEKAGKKVAKDLEYDMKHDGKDDDKAEKAGKKVTKDIEYDDKKDKEDKVDETTVSGSVATSASGDAPKKGKGGMQFGQGVYEGQVAESFETKLKNVLTEGMSVNVSTDDTGKKSISVNATDADADALGDMLKMAGLFSSEGYSRACTDCGGIHEAGACGTDMVEEELANSPDEVYADADYMTQTLSGGLNGPKTTGQTTGAVVNRQDSRQGVMAESERVKEQAESRLWNLYKKI